MHHEYSTSYFIGTAGSMTALAPVLTIFTKTILHLNTERITNEKKALNQLERLSWDALLEISPNFISQDNPVLTDVLVAQHNLAHFFVKSIETPKALVDSDFAALIRSCLKVIDSHASPNLTREIFKFLIALKAHQTIFSPPELPTHYHFNPLASPNREDLLQYLKELSYQTNPIREDESNLFNEVYQETTIHCNFTSSFTALNLTNICLALIRKLVEPETIPPRTVTDVQGPSRETLKKHPSLDSSKIPPSPSSSSLTSNDSDEFQAEILIENPSPAKSTIAPPIEPLVSIGLDEELDLILEDDFAERHHRIVGPDSSKQGSIFKEVVEKLKGDPNLFAHVIKNKTPINNLNSSVKFTPQQTLDSSDHPRTKPVADSSGSLSSPVKGLPDQGRGSSDAQDHHSPGAQHLEHASTLASSQRPEHLDPASAAPPHPPVQDRTTFCFNAPQEDASQIQFESPAIRENSISDQDGHSSFAEEDQLEEDPLPAPSTSRQRHKSNHLSWNQRGRSKFLESDSESDEDQLDQRRRHKEGDKYTSPSPIPVPRKKKRPHENHSVARKQQKSISPRPLPTQKHKKNPSERHSATRKRRQSTSSPLPASKRRRRSTVDPPKSSKKKTSDHRRNSRMTQSPPRVGRNFWTPEEEKLLIKEVEKFYYMKNCMAHILSRHGPNGQITHILARRTGVNLKDKAINLSTKWYANRVRLSEKRKKAFARFPPKGVFKCNLKTESDSEDSSSTRSSKDESETEDESDEEERINGDSQRDPQRERSVTPLPEPLDLMMH